MKTFSDLTKELNEAKKPAVIHSSYTSAVQAALDSAVANGYEYDDDESFSKIGMGPKKPSDGKTNRFTIELTKNGKKSRKALHFQVYGMGDKYELNSYIS